MYKTNQKAASILRIFGKVRIFGKTRTVICLFLLCSSLPALAQHLTQNIRGTVTDQASGMPVPYATIQLAGIPAKGAVSDSLGNFLLTGIPLGRHTVKASFIGYEPSLIREVSGSHGTQPVVHDPENRHRSIGILDVSTSILSLYDLFDRLLFQSVGIASPVSAEEEICAVHALPVCRNLPAGRCPNDGRTHGIVASQPAG